MAATPVPQFAPVLEGFGVRLEALSRDHIDGLSAAGRNASIWAHLAFPWPLAETRMEQFVTDAIRDRDKLGEQPYTIIAQDRIVGSTRVLDARPTHRGYEIGWTWLAVEAQRTHVNTAAKRLLLEECFERQNAARVHFKTDARNEQSQRALERLGAVREGTLRQHMQRPDGTMRDSVFFSILDHEWPALKPRLEARIAKLQSKSS